MGDPGMARRASQTVFCSVHCLAAVFLVAAVPAARGQWAEIAAASERSLVTVTALVSTEEPGIWRRHVGTGLIVSTGRVLTSSYVLAGAEALFVEGRGGRRAVGHLIAGDGLSRLALLRVPDQMGDPIDLERMRDPTVGESIAIIGTAYGFPNKLSPGVVSGLDRTLMDEGLPAMTAAFEVSADAEPGMSGAPVFASDGSLVGTVLISTLPEPGSAHSPLDGGGLVAYNLLLPESLPEDRRTGPSIIVANPLVLCAEGGTLRYACQHLLAHGEVPWGRAGLSVGPTPTDLVEYFGLTRAPGALVLSVADDGPADAAGLEEGDVLLTVDGAPLESGASLMRRVLDRPGETIAVEYLRREERRATSLALGTAVVSLRGVTQAARPEAWLGLVVSPVSESLAAQLGIEREALSVASVAEGSPALAAGLRSGDVILRVAGEAATIEKLQGLVGHGVSVDLTVLRAGQVITVSVSAGTPPPGVSLHASDALGLAEL